MDPRHCDIKEKFAVYVSSPNAYTRPDKARQCDVKATGNFRDTSQKNLTIILNAIGIRVQPIMIEEPVAIEHLENECSLNGEGYKFVIGSEVTDGYAGFDGNKIDWLVRNLDGMILYNRTKLVMGKNIEIVYNEIE